MVRLWTILSATIFFLSGCTKESDSNRSDTILLETSGRFEGSNLAGNLMATAIRDVYKVDFAFYPSSYLSADRFAVIEPGMTSEQITNLVLPLYPEAGDRDNFQIGTLKGSDIKKFILNRTAKDYKVDLQVAGIEYDIQFLGGLPTIAQVNREHGLPIIDDQYYRIAISDYEYYGTFPGYRYYNGFDHSFRPEDGLYSAREALISFLSGFKRLPLLNDKRVQMRMRLYGDDPINLSIPEIQGRLHLSPFIGKRVKTQGVVTAAAQLRNVPGMEIYVQSQEGDGDSETSDAINVHLDSFIEGFKVGQLIEVEGTVYEVLTYQGMTRTALREVTKISIIEDSVPLPEPVVIGTGGVMPPNHYVSRHIGNVNQKKSLDPSEGIDFWERFEGMRLKLSKPTVVGFSGGESVFEDRESYLTLYLAPEGSSPVSDMTSHGGLISNEAIGDFNPQIVRLVDSTLSTGFTKARMSDYKFEVGNKFSSDVEGIFSFQTNNFGDGEFVLFPQSVIESTTDRIPTQAQRPKAKMEFAEEKLTVASYNVENLPASLGKRIERIAEGIRVNLKCPDILVLPEIQDFNGADYAGGADAEPTLKAIADAIQCPNAVYKGVNVDPVPQQDGGEPGGNIRVAMLYNENRVQFNRRGEAKALDDNLVDRDGNLILNPGRIYPNDPAFERSRKPLAAQFTFRGQTVYVVGAHLNSKLGDGNAWGAEQPLPYGSTAQRNLLGTRINEFVKTILLARPDAKVLVAGDMNAYYFEDSMKILEGKALTNLMSYGNLVEPADRYSISFNGNSQGIDHIFVSKGLLDLDAKFEVVHINTDYMLRASDHDPVISQYTFP